MANRQVHTTEIVRAMGEIAARADKLARDAANQAAQAGDAGRGFAGVAEEAQELAERCAEEVARFAGTLANADLERADLRTAHLEAARHTAGAPERPQQRLHAEGVGAEGSPADDGASRQTRKNLARLIVTFSIGLSAPAAAVFWLLAALGVVHWSLWLPPAFGATGLFLANLIEWARIRREAQAG
jgi:hypothetical protein